MMIEWNQLKSIIDSKGVFPQFTETAALYFIKLYDGYTLVGECIINKNLNLEDRNDFETNYKSGSNQRLSQYDNDGAMIVRAKAAKKGWTYSDIPIEVKPSDLNNSIFSKLPSGDDRPGISYRIYDANGPILDPQLQANAIRTEVDFEPLFDYEIIGGSLRTETDVAVDARLWIIAVPDIPPQFGGSKEMLGGINLRSLAPQNTTYVDGRVSKTLIYNPDLHTNKLRFLFKHPPGFSVKIYISIEMYKE